MKSLPRKPSALLRIAVEDAQKCEASPRYVLDMGSWHSPDGGKCSVCMAGAVMAQRLEADPDHYFALDDFNGNTARALDAIDDMRMADFERALVTLRQVTTEQQLAAVDEATALIERNFNGDDRFVRRAPWPVYLKAADILEAVDL